MMLQWAAVACGDTQGGLSQQPASFPLAVVTQPPASPLLRRANEEERWSRLPCSLLSSSQPSRVRRRGTWGEHWHKNMLGLQGSSIGLSINPTPSQALQLLQPTFISTLATGGHAFLCQPRKLYLFFPRSLLYGEPQIAALPRGASEPDTKS